MGGSYLGLLRRNRDFRRLYAATLISLAGDWFLAVALVDLVLKMTGKATLVALLNLAMSLPVFLLTPWAGSVVDRTNRRRLMIAMDLVRVGAALLPLLATSPVRLLFAYAGVCMLSTCSAYFEPAADAALPNLVAPEDLGRANVFLGAAWGSMMAVGATLGGLVTTYSGRTTAFVIDALSFLLSAALLFGIRAPFTQTERSPGARRSFFQSLGETVRYAREKPQVLALLVVKAIYGLGAGLMALLAIFGEKIFDRGAQGISLIMVARGAGATLGPVLLNSTVRLSQQCRVIAPGLALFSVGYLGLAVSPNITLGMAAVLLSHIGATVLWQASAVTLQTVVPDGLRGRVFAADNGLWTLSFSVSSVCAGVLADRYSVRGATLGIACFGLGSALLWGLITRRLWLPAAAKASANEQV